MNSPLTTFLTRLFAGISGGLLGMVAALLVFLLSSFANPTEAGLAESYSLVSILAMVFVGTVVANLVVGFILGKFESHKYHQMRGMMFQIFFFTLSLFLFMIPFYLFTTESLLTTAGIHFLAGSLLCALVCEIMSSRTSALTGLMGALLAGCFLYGLLSLLFSAEATRSVLLIFFLPMAWICIMTGIFLAEVLHSGVKNLYGIDLFEAEPSDNNPH